MKNLILTTLFTFICFNAYTQVAFDAGYFIDNEGHRTDCLIRNLDKSTNPSQFEYKLSENSEPEIATIDSVSEFEILNTIHKFKRFKVNIDRSSDELSELSSSKKMDFKEEKLFLRKLVEGKASLYSFYDRGGIKKFFYTIDDSEIEQLVFKKYLTEGNKVAENNSYKQQIWVNLNCHSFSESYIKNIRYKENDLVRLFVKYNECTGAEYINHLARKDKGVNTFTIKAGVNTSSLEIQQRVSYMVEDCLGCGTESYFYQLYTTQFDQRIFPIIGMELEHIFPFNKKRWSVFVEPTFYYYKSKQEFIAYHTTSNSSPPSNPGAAGGAKGNLTVNYSHISLPIGVRHSFFLKNSSSIFINGGLGYNLILMPSKAFFYDNPHKTVDFNQGRLTILPGFLAGFGYKYKDMVSVEARFHSKKPMLDTKSWRTWQTNSVSLIFGYKIR